MVTSWMRPNVYGFTSFGEINQCVVIDRGAFEMYQWMESSRLSAIHSDYFCVHIFALKHICMQWLEYQNVIIELSTHI